MANPQTRSHDPAPLRSEGHLADARVRALIAAGTALFVGQVALSVTANSSDGAEFVAAEVILIFALALTTAGFSIAAAHTRGDERRGWHWLTAGAAVYLLGEVAWAVDETSLADLFYLGAFPLFYAGLWVRNRTSGRPAARGEGLVESLIVMGVFGLVLWEGVIQPGIEPGDSVTQALITVAYPIGDLGLLWLILRSAYRSERRWTEERVWLGLGFLALICADTVFALPETAASVAVSDLLYVSSALALALAGLSVTWAKDRDRPASGGRPLLVDLMPYVAGVAMGLVPIWQILEDERDLDSALIALVILILVLVRLSMTVRQNREMRRRAEETAMVDGLTNLWNHRYFYERLDGELARAGREGGTVGVLMIDIDNFKSFNDTAGHLAGDQLLRELGAALRKVGRPSDTAARVGGDELAVIAPGTRERELLSLAQRIAWAAAAIRIEVPADAEALHPSLSIGAAVYPSQAGNSITLIECADAALYRSKRDGRARVSLYEPDRPGSPAEELVVARETIRARELDFTALFEAARDPLLVLDNRAVILDANPATVALTGLSVDELRDRSIFDFAVPGADDTFETLRVNALESGHAEGEQQIRMPDGEVRMVEFTNTTVSPGRHLLTVRDITEREQAARQIAESENKFRSLFEHAPDAIYITDDAGTIVEVNQAAVALGGIAAEQLIGARLDELVAPGQVEELTDELDTLRAEGAGRGVFEGVWPDGSEHAVEYTSVADFLPGRHLSIVRDVTAQASAMRSASEHEALFRAVLGTIDEGVAVVAPDGSVSALNPAGVEIIGLPEEDVVGRSVFDPSWETLDERGRQLEPDVRPLARMLHEGEPAPPSSFGLRRPDGSVAWIKILARFDAGEQGTGRALVVRFAGATTPWAARAAERKRERRTAARHATKPVR